MGRNDKPTVADGAVVVGLMLLSAGVALLALEGPDWRLGLVVFGALLVMLGMAAIARYG